MMFGVRSVAQIEASLALLEEMTREGVLKNEVTFSTAVKALSCAGSPSSATQNEDSWLQVLTLFNALAVRCFTSVGVGILLVGMLVLDVVFGAVVPWLSRRPFSNVCRRPLYPLSICFVQLNAFLHFVYDLKILVHVVQARWGHFKPAFHFTFFQASKS